MLGSRVFIYGDQSIGSGGWCYRRAFERKHFEVSSFSDWEGLEKYRERLLYRGYRRIAHGVRERDRLHHVTTLMRDVEAFSPSLIIVLKGLHLGPHDLLKLRSYSPLIVNVNHDDFFSAYPLNWSQLQRASIPHYDYIFTTRSVNLAEVRPLNPHVAYFPFAYDPEIHRPCVIPKGEEGKWNVDVVFVGTYAKHRAALLTHLIPRVAARYAIYGSGWHRVPRFSPLRPHIRGQTLHLDELARALGAAKIALGFLRKENRDDYTQRTFEIPACGGLLLAERTDLHTSLFREGIEAEFFSSENGDELVEKVKDLLGNAERREAIRTAGQQAVKRINSTYDKRITELLSVLGASDIARTSAGRV